jgi:hypothetical protein
MKLCYSLSTADFFVETCWIKSRGFYIDCIIGKMDITPEFLACEKKRRITDILVCTIRGAVTRICIESLIYTRPQVNLLIRPSWFRAFQTGYAGGHLCKMTVNDNPKIDFDSIEDCIEAFSTFWHIL